MLVYFHIPFCKSKCPYCAFGSKINSEHLIDDYFKALLDEVDKIKPSNIKTIFIGGGTPSIIHQKYYYMLFKNLDLSKTKEITIEANPSLISLKWLKDIRALGINRISFGAQSFNDEKLKFLGRNHTSKDIFKAINLAKEANFTNINIDLIYDTKFDTLKNLEFECKNLEKIDINHLSAYSLTLEENTPFFNKKSYKLNRIKNIKFFLDQIKNLGFIQYEISNFSKNSPCLHNIGYWSAKDYLGFGAYAVSKIKNKRIYNKSLSLYLKNIMDKKIEILSDKDLKFEHIFLGARSNVGISINKLTKKEINNANKLVDEGLLKLENKRFYALNFLLADEIALFLSS